MSQKHQKSQARSISVNAIAEKPLLIWDYVAFAAIAVFCFLVFQQSDLLHTAGCSYGYLNGHFRDFYDYCGTFDIHPAYMPSFYLIFAIWNIPMRLFGIVTFPTENLPVLAILWAKLLPCLIYVASGVLIYHIAILAGMGSKKSKLCAYACLTMPVAFYAQFIFGQYDIIMTFCVLLGVYYYLKKKDIWFIFWFAIAIVLPKICIASFHLFVFHLQFFLFTGNDLPALLSKKWFMRQVFWHIDRKNLLFYASLSEEFFRFYLKIAPIWDKDILSYYAGFYYWKCFTWNIFCIFAWLGGLKHKKIGDFWRCFTWNILKSTVLQ